VRANTFMVIFFVELIRGCDQIFCFGSPRNSNKEMYGFFCRVTAVALQNKLYAFTPACLRRQATFEALESRRVPLLCFSEPLTE
jgi:hypothetical protein